MMTIYLVVDLLGLAAKCIVSTLFACKLLSKTSSAEKAFSE